MDENLKGIQNVVLNIAREYGFNKEVTTKTIFGVRSGVMEKFLTEKLYKFLLIRKDEVSQQNGVSERMKALRLQDEVEKVLFCSSNDELCIVYYSGILRFSSMTASIRNCIKDIDREISFDLWLHDVVV